MRIKDRHTIRQDKQSTRVILEWNLAKSFVEAKSALVMSEYEYAPSSDSEGAWTVHNLSNSGAGLERLSYSSLDLGVGAMIGLSWIPHHGEPMLGFIRWIKEPKPGEQRMGIQFFSEKFQLVKAGVMGGGDELTEKRTWPVLIKPTPKANIAIFPDARIYKNMTFAVGYEGKTIHMKVEKIVQSGNNFTICHVLKPKELEITTGGFDFNKKG